MSSGELLVIVFVAVVVFGPQKLPLLAEHLGKALRYFHRMKQQTGDYWQLLENQRKAETADEMYQKNRKTQGEPPINDR